MDGKYTTFYKSIGMPEWRLIVADKRKRFAVETLTGNFFYPMLLFDYALQLAKNFNTNDKYSEYAGLVVAFELPAETLTDYEQLYRDDATPPEKLWFDFLLMREINAQIITPMRIVESFYGDRYTGTRWDPQELNDCGFL